MDHILAEITTSQWPIIFSVGAGLVGMTGIITALMAHASISRDISAIKRAETILASTEAWEGSGTHSEHELSEWMRSRLIHPESGVADVIRACWSAWTGSRGTSLTELHVLVARRERSKAPARLSAGIAALLLIIGIVGTLSSVKPILEAFQFRPSAPEGVIPADDAPSLVNVEDSAALVNSLMHSLGEAFLPSLVALIATVLVVIVRGIYSLGLHSYTLQLDRFAMRTVMPRFRPRSISDEYEDVRKTFGALAKAIGEREAKMDVVVAQLTKFVDSVGPTLNGLDNGIDKLTIAADALASKSNSIATTLTRTLGKTSPLYEAVNGFEGIFAATNQRLEQLSSHIEGIKAEHQKHRTAMLGTLEEISGVISKVSGDHQRDRENALKTITDLESLVATIPAKLLDSARKTFDDGIFVMRKRLQEALDQQAKEASSTNQDIRSKTQMTLDSISTTLSNTTRTISDSLKAVPEAVNRLNEALKGKSDIEKAAANAIDSLAGEAKDGIRSASANAIRNSEQPLIPAPQADPALSHEPLRPPVSDQQQPQISVLQAAHPSAPEPPISQDIDKKNLTLPIPRIVNNPSLSTSISSTFDKSQAHPPAFQDTTGTNFQTYPQVTTETNHVKPKRGFFGGLFGGRKP